MLVYSEVGDDDTPINLWSRDALISIREYEKDIVLEEDYSSICLAEQVKKATDTTKEEVKCVSYGISSVLNLLPDKNKLEQMTQA